MILLIPIDEKSYEDAKIVSLEDMKCWIVVEMDAGFIKKYSFFDNKNSIDDFIDFVIVRSVDEDVEEFLNEGIDVLVAPSQIHVDDIVEAYKFKELHEI